MLLFITAVGDCGVLGKRAVFSEEGELLTIVQAIEKNAQRVDIGAMVAAHLAMFEFLLIDFRRHIRARTVETGGGKFAFELRLANIAKTEMLMVIHEDVAGLDVAVEDAFIFETHQRLSDFHAQAESSGMTVSNDGKPFPVIQIQRHADQHGVLNDRTTFCVDKNALQIFRLHQILSNILFSAKAVHDLSFALAGCKTSSMKSILWTAGWGAILKLQRIGNEFQSSRSARLAIHSEEDA